MSKDILGGDVSTIVSYRPDQMSFGTAVEAARQEQEQICGYRLLLSKSRSTELADKEGRYVEVMVTFSPYPPSEVVEHPPVVEPPRGPIDGTIVMEPIPPGTIVR